METTAQGPIPEINCNPVQKLGCKTKMTSYYSFCECGKVWIDRYVERKFCGRCNKELTVKWMGKDLTNEYLCCNCRKKFPSGIVDPVKRCSDCGHDAFSRRYQGDFYNKLREFSRQLKSLSTSYNAFRIERITDRIADWVLSYEPIRSIHDGRVMYETLPWFPK